MRPAAVPRGRREPPDGRLASIYYVRYGSISVITDCCFNVKILASLLFLEIIIII